MALSDFLLYLLAGRLWTWLLQTNGLTRPVWDLHPKLKELSECDLCLGFWVYLVLALRRREKGPFPPSEGGTLTLAAGSALLAHLLRLGWQAKFGITVIE